MLKDILKKSNRKKGATIFTMIGVAAAICLFGLVFLELQTMYDYQYGIEVRAQRALNSCVEFAMDDQWRADGYNYMDEELAENSLQSFLESDLNVDSRGRCYSGGKLLYELTFGAPEFHSGNPNKYCADCRRFGCRRDAGIVMTITVTMNAGMAKYYNIAQLRNGYTWTQEFSSTNFRTDNDERAGA